MADTSGTPLMHEIWAKCVDMIKQSIISPGLWRALEKTMAVAYEENNFVIGFTSFEGTASNQLNSTDYRMQIEKALRTLTGVPTLRLRVIEGNEYSDWEAVKKQDAAAAQSQAQSLQKRVTETSAYNTWEEVYEQVSRMWANSEFRSLPTGRAAYLTKALDVLLDVMETLYPAKGFAPEKDERGLSRVVERIGGMTNTDAAVVAYLLFERRAARKAQA